MPDLHISQPVDSLFYVGHVEPPGFRVSVVTGLMLPGVELSKRAFRADKRCPDELAALYDDVLHEVRISQQLFALCLEDVTQVQTRLF